MRAYIKQLTVSVCILSMVGIVCYALGYGFYQQQPLRDSDYFTMYVGPSTHCNTVNYYQQKGDQKKVEVLLSYAEDNAMEYLMKRFGKDKGMDIVGACEMQRHEALVSACMNSPEAQVEMLVLEHNKPQVKEKGLI